MKKFANIAISAFALAFGLCLVLGSFAEAASVLVQGTVRSGFSGLGHFSGSNPDGSSYEGDTLLKVQINQCWSTNPTPDPSGAYQKICVDLAPIPSSVDGFTYSKNLVFPDNAILLGPIEVKVNLVQDRHDYYPGGGTGYSVISAELGKMQHAWFGVGDTLIMDHKRIPGSGAGSPPPISGGSISTMPGAQSPSQNVMPW